MRRAVRDLFLSLARDATFADRVNNASPTWKTGALPQPRCAAAVVRTLPAPAEVPA